MELEFSRQVFEKYPISNFLIRLMGAQLLHADGRADMTKLIVDFRNVADALENWCFEFSARGTGTCDVLRE
jgi:hypothetical protein